MLMSVLSVADYIQIRDPKVDGADFHSGRIHQSYQLKFMPDQSVGDLSEKTFTFSLQNLPPTNIDSSQPAILAFRVGPDTVQTKLGFHVFLNGTDVFNASFANSTTFRTFHEMIEPAIGGTSTLLFKLDKGGVGSMTFADVVLWYKRFVPYSGK